jgi:hypothetical protein
MMLSEHTEIVRILDDLTQVHLKARPFWNFLTIFATDIEYSTQKTISELASRAVWQHHLKMLWAIAYHSQEALQVKWIREAHNLDAWSSLAQKFYRNGRRLSQRPYVIHLGTVCRRH